MPVRASLPPLLLAIGLSGLLGCTPTVNSRVTGAPPTLAADQIPALRSSPDVTQLVRELSREGAKAAVASLSEDEVMEHLDHIVAELARALAVELKKQSNELHAASKEMSTDVTTAAIHALAAELPKTLGPALREVILQDLVQRPEVRSALGEMSREVGKQVVLGSNDALTDLATAKKQGSSAPLGMVANVLEGHTSTLVLGAAVLALIVLLVRFARERRSVRREHEALSRRAAVATALLRSADAESDPATRRLLEQVSAALSEAEAA